MLTASEAGAPTLYAAAQGLQAGSRCLAHGLRHLIQPGHTQRRAVHGQFPAQLPGIQVDGSAAGDAPGHGDTVGAAVIEVDFLAQGLVAAGSPAGHVL